MVEGLVDVETWRAVPPPRIVVAAGAYAISGGPFAGLAGGPLHPRTSTHPFTVLDGLLRLLGRL